MTKKQEEYLNGVLLPTLRLPEVAGLTVEEASALIEDCKRQLGWGSGPIPDMLIPSGQVFETVRSAFKAALREQAQDLSPDQAAFLLRVLSKKDWLHELEKTYMSPARTFGHSEAEKLANDMPRLLANVIETYVLQK